MRFKVIELDFMTDRIRGVRRGMTGYTTGLVCEYLGHRLYEVDLDGRYHQLYDWQIEII